jgi:hypothetical protein
MAISLAQSLLLRPGHIVEIVSRLRRDQTLPPGPDNVREERWAGVITHVEEDLNPESKDCTAIRYEGRGALAPAFGYFGARLEATVYGVVEAVIIGEEAGVDRHPDFAAIARFAREERIG